MYQLIKKRKLQNSRSSFKTMNGETLGQVLQPDTVVKELLSDPNSFVGIFTLEELGTTQILKPEGTICLIINTDPDPNDETGEH